MTNKSKKSKSSKNVEVADRSLSRVINQRAIIDRINDCHGISRAQLAKELGISKPTVTSNVEHLIELGLVIESGEGKAAKSGGRKPVMLYLNSTQRYVGALDLSFREPVCAIADLKLKIIGINKIQVEEDEGSEKRKEEVRKAFLNIMEEHDIDPNKLDTIVISNPGIIEDDKENYVEKRHHAWTELGLGDYLKEQMNVHISIRNDVNLAAIGEMNYSCDRKIENLIYVSCGVGIGAGIIINRELYAGEKNAAGEIGASLMQNDQRFEDYIAMEGLIKRAKAVYLENDTSSKMNFSKIISLAEENNEQINQVIYDTGRELGRAIYNCCITMDIRTVIFGGEYLELGDKLFEGIEDVLEMATIFKPTVLQSDLKQIAGIYGCFIVGTRKVIERIVAS